MWWGENKKEQMFIFCYTFENICVIIAVILVMLSKSEKGGKHGQIYFTFGIQANW